MKNIIFKFIFKLSVFGIFFVFFNWFIGLYESAHRVKRDSREACQPLFEARRDHRIIPIWIVNAREELPRLGHLGTSR